MLVGVGLGTAGKGEGLVASVGVATSGEGVGLAASVGGAPTELLGRVGKAVVEGAIKKMSSVEDEGSWVDVEGGGGMDVEGEGVTWGACEEEEDGTDWRETGVEVTPGAKEDEVMKEVVSASGTGEDTEGTAEVVASAGDDTGVVTISGAGTDVEGTGVLSMGAGVEEGGIGVVETPGADVEEGGTGVDVTSGGGGVVVMGGAC